MADGSTIKSVDDNFDEIRWELIYDGLTDQERVEFESFFEQVEGSLKTFTYVDPGDNMLLWSEDLTRPSWSKDPLLSTESIVDNPSSQSSTLCTNSAQIPQSFHQIIKTAPWQTHCFSCLVSGPASSEIKLILSSEDGELTSEARLKGAWQRISCSGSITGTGSELKCCVQIEAGGRASVRELNVCAQKSPGEYRSTTSRAAVYAKTRFATDHLAFDTAGPESHSLKVTLISSRRH